MIIRDIAIQFGHGLIETTPFVADATVGGEKTVVAGLKMKNITDADCVGSINLIFTNRHGLDFLKKKLYEMEENWDSEAFPRGETK